jgi:hypothetical protein
VIVSLKPLIARLNSTTRSVLEGAANLCLSRTHFDVDIEHFLMKLQEAEGTDFQLIAKSFNVDRARTAAGLLRSLDRFKTGNARTPALSPHLVEALTQAWLYGSLEFDAVKIRSGFVLLALLAKEDLARLVREINVELQKINVEELRSRFAVIVRGSIEDDSVAEPAEVPAVSEATGGPRVFISYRRDDSSIYAEFLFSCLRAEVPGLRIFRDDATLKPGMVYSETIDETVSACDFLVAIIGKKWRGRKDASGNHRIDDSDDLIRLEVAAALRQEKIVIPCLIGGARMPKREELPHDIADLIQRQSITLSEKNLRRDAEQLVNTLKNWRRISSS